MPDFTVIEGGDPRKREATEFHDLHAGLTVSMISTGRKNFICCDKEDRLRSVAASNAEKFDYMPVQDRGHGDDHIVGVVRLFDYFEADAPDV
ncbi:hypothetical protein AB4144_06620, partial [Rhizobiaceae sp. 2RAB30]